MFCEGFFENLKRAYWLLIWGPPRPQKQETPAPRLLTQHNSTFATKSHDLWARFRNQESEIRSQENTKRMYETLTFGTCIMYFPDS